MRVLAEKVSLLVLGPTLALLVGTRFDGFFIAGLLLAVSIAGLVEWLRPAAQWSWVLCAAFLAIAVTLPSWCAFMPLIAYDMARLPAVASPETRAAASDRFPSASPSRPLVVRLPTLCAQSHDFLPPYAGYGCCRYSRFGSPVAPTASKRWRWRWLHCSDSSWDGPESRRMWRGARCCERRIWLESPLVRIVCALPISMRNAPNPFVWQYSVNAHVSPGKSTTMWAIC